MSSHPILCPSCKARLAVEQISEPERDALAQQHSHTKFVEELRQLLMLQDFYARHPTGRKIKPHYWRVLESKDPFVMKQRSNGVDFGDILLPEEEWQSSETITEADLETVEYLRHNAVDLEHRLRFVRSRVTEATIDVMCPLCHEGKLTVPAEDWWAFYSWGGSVFHRINSGCIGDAGTIQILLSGYARDCHWSGTKAIAPDDPDFDFWNWLIEQPEHQRSIEEREINAIRENWLATRKPSDS